MKSLVLLFWFCEHTVLLVKRYSELFQAPGRGVNRGPGLFPRPRGLSTRSLDKTAFCCMFLDVSDF